MCFGAAITCQPQARGTSYVPVRAASASPPATRPPGHPVESRGNGMYDFWDRVQFMKVWNMDEGNYTPYGAGRK